MFLVELCLVGLIYTLGSKPVVLSLLIIISTNAWLLNSIILTILVVSSILWGKFHKSKGGATTTLFKKRFRHLNKYSLPGSTDVVMQKRFKFIFLMLISIMLICL